MVKTFFKISQPHNLGYLILKLLEILGPNWVLSQAKVLLLNIDFRVFPLLIINH